MEQELQWIVQNLRAIIADLNDECSVGTGITLDTVEGYKWRVELIYREMLAKEIVSGQLLDAEKNALDCFAKAFEAINYLVDTLMSCPGSMGIIAAKQAPVILTGAVGRPAFEISIHQLQYLVENRFSVPQIAELLGVSVSSVRR